MSKIIRRTVKKRGAALIVALQITALTFLSLVSFVSGPQQSAPPQDGFAVANNAPADSQVSADQTQTQTAQAPTAAVKDNLRASAVFAQKLRHAGI